MDIPEMRKRLEALDEDMIRNAHRVLAALATSARRAPSTPCAGPTSRKRRSAGVWLRRRHMRDAKRAEAGKPGQNHHLLVGHLDDFQSSNLAVVEDATRTFHGMEATAIRADVTWLRKKASRLPLLEQMTAADKQAFTEAMNRRFPVAMRPGNAEARHRAS